MQKRNVVGAIVQWAVVLIGASALLAHGGTLWAIAYLVLGTAAAVWLWRGGGESAWLPPMLTMRKHNRAVSVQAAQIGKQVQEATARADAQEKLAQEIFQLTEKSSTAVDGVQSSINVIACVANE